MASAPASRADRSARVASASKPRRRPTARTPRSTGRRAHSRAISSPVVAFERLVAELRERRTRGGAPAADPCATASPARRAPDRPSVAPRSARVRRARPAPPCALRHGRTGARRTSRLRAPPGTSLAPPRDRALRAARRRPAAEGALASSPEREHDLPHAGGRAGRAGCRPTGTSPPRPGAAVPRPGRPTRRSPAQPPGLARHDGPGRASAPPARARNAAAAATPPRARARPPSVPAPRPPPRRVARAACARCQARRSGSSCGSVASAIAPWTCLRSACSPCGRPPTAPADGGTGPARRSPAGPPPGPVPPRRVRSPAAAARHSSVTSPDRFGRRGQQQTTGPAGQWFQRRTKPCSMRLVTERAGQAEAACDRRRRGRAAAPAARAGCRAASATIRSRTARPASRERRVQQRVRAACGRARRPSSGSPRACRPWVRARRTPRRPARPAAAARRTPGSARRPDRATAHRPRGRSAAAPRRPPPAG